MNDRFLKCVISFRGSGFHTNLVFKVNNPAYAFSIKTGNEFSLQIMSIWCTLVARQNKFLVTLCSLINYMQIPNAYLFFVCFKSYQLVYKLSCVSVVLLIKTVSFFNEWIIGFFIQSSRGHMETYCYWSGIRNIMIVSIIYFASKTWTDGNVSEGFISTTVLFAKGILCIERIATWITASIIIYVQGPSLDNE